MTVINPNSISGITSITLPSGDGNVLTIHTNDGVERFRIDSTGNIKVGSAATISPDGDLFVTGVCTATTLAGSGANLTNLPAANVTGTLPAISGANLTSLTAGNLTGALPAISGANLTGIAATDNVRTGILDVAGIATFRSDVNIPNINGGQVGGRRNKIINGAMQISQRGTSQSGTNSSGYKTVCDRWRLNANGSNVGTYTVSQSTTSPDGFSNSYKIDCTTARTPSNDEMYELEQRFEGQDLQDFAKGTSAAKQFSLSFYVKSNVNGNYVVWLYDADNNRNIGAVYTVSDSNWNRYTVTFPADTTGAFGNDNARSLDVRFVLLSGSDFTSGTLPTTAWESTSNGNSRAGQTANVASSTSNEWYLTGVQLEVGSTATAFEHRSFGEELRLCQRYFHKSDGETDSGFRHWAHPYNCTTAARRVTILHPQTMRVAPTFTNLLHDQDTGDSNTSGSALYNSNERWTFAKDAESTAGWCRIERWWASAEL